MRAAIFAASYALWFFAATHARAKEMVTIVCYLERDSEKMNLTFVLDVNQNLIRFPVVLIGNNGGASAIGSVENGNLVIIETPGAGPAVTTINLSSTPIYGVHARNMWMAGKNLVSMYSGRCEFK